MGYERSVQEGHDARLFRFTPTDDTVSGSHQDPKNLEYWKVGCLGLTEPCTATWEILKLSRLALTLASSKIWMVALIHVLLHMECWSRVRSQKLLPLITLELVPKKQLTSQLEACAHNKH